MVDDLRKEARKKQDDFTRLMKSDRGNEGLLSQKPLQTPRPSTDEEFNFEAELSKIVDLNITTDAVVPRIGEVIRNLEKKEQTMLEAPTPLSDPTAISSEKLQQGYKADETKVRYELLPPEPLHAISMVLTKGAEKYADRNWEKGILYSRVFGALMRHLWAWWGGKLNTNHNFAFGDLDPEWQYSHLWHAGCCLFFLISYEERQMKTFDDRPTTGGVA